MNPARIGRLTLDGGCLLLLLLLAATVGQGLPTPAAVGLPLAWKLHFFLVLAMILVAGLWAAVSLRLDHAWPSLQRLAASPVASCCILALFLILAKLPCLRLPYFWDAMGYVVSGAWETYNDDFPLILSPLFDSGHPPLFYLLLALAWKAVAPTLVVSHLFNLLWGILAAWGTYALGRRLYGPSAGLWAALLFCLSPLFYAQVGTLHFEPSLAALTVWAVYFTLTRRLPAYLLATTAMVLIKEPSVVLVPAVCLSVLVGEGRGGRRRALTQAALYALPVAPLAAWLIYHRAHTGWFLTPPDVPKEARLFLPQLYAPLLCIVKEQYRWMLSLSALAAVAAWLHASPRHAWREWMRKDATGLPLICAVAFVGYWLPTGMVFFSPRYLLPLLPLYFVLAGAGLCAAFGARTTLAGAICALLFVGAWQHPPERGYDLGGYLRYTSYLRTHQQAAAWLAEHAPDARVLANYPLSRELSSPIYGFTQQPVPIVAAARLPEATAWDYWVFSEESEFNPIDFPGHRQIQERYRLVARFVDQATVPRGYEPEVRIYESPAISERAFVDLEVLADGTLVKLAETGLVLRGNRRLAGAPVPAATAARIKFTPDGTGAYLLSRDGRVQTWGSATHRGDLSGATGIDACDLELWPGGQGYLMLASDGRVFAFGSARPPQVRPVTGEQVARDLAVTASGGVYVLYGSGKIAAYGAPETQGPHWDSDAARAFAASPAGTGWYILDLYGGVHTPGVPPAAARKPAYYWKPDGLAVDLVFGRDGRGYLLDRKGDVDSF